MKIMAVGDVYLGETIDLQDKQQYFSSDIIQKIKNADVAFCNLESPLTLSTEQQDSHYSKLLDNMGRAYLRSPPKIAEFIANIGFDVVSIANNHIMDYKKRGLEDTIETLESCHIKHVGAGVNLSKARQPEIIEKSGTKIGFLAYSYTYEATKFCAGSAPLWPSIIKEDIGLLKNRCDILVVSLHFGEEYINSHRAKEIKFCRSLIDEGANVILGHHPHVLRGIEKYKGGLIVYSLGNFVFNYHPVNISFGKNIKGKTKESIILEMDFEKGCMKKWKIHPVYLNENGFPNMPSNDKERCAILNNVAKYNEDINLKDKLPVSRNDVYYIRRVKTLLKLVAKSIYTKNFTNIYLLLTRFYKEM